MWEYRARVVRVIDGDTLVLLCDTGFNGRQEEHFRLTGVSAPELSEPEGPRVSGFVSLWCEQRQQRDPAVKWPFLVRTEINTNPEPDERRTFTRYLAEVFDLARPGDASLNAAVNGYLELLGL